MCSQSARRTRRSSHPRRVWGAGDRGLPRGLGVDRGDVMGRDGALVVACRCENPLCAVGVDQKACGAKIVFVKV